MQDGGLLLFSLPRDGEVQELLHQCGPCGVHTNSIAWTLINLVPCRQVDAALWPLPDAARFCVSVVVLTLKSIQEARGTLLNGVLSEASVGLL